jgi:hypothetical protein
VSALSAALVSRAFCAGVSLNFTMADCTLVLLCGVHGAQLPGSLRATPAWLAVYPAS